jgi:fibronectin type 3 domain-containing protein
VARSKKVGLSWAASTDNTRVTGYRVYRDGTQVATVSNTKWTDPLAFKGGLRSYALVAFDAAGNTSPAAGVTVQ